MKRKTIAVMTWLAICLSGTALFGARNTDNLNQASEYYNQGRYRRALYYFEKAKTERHGAEQSRFIQYAVQVMKRFEGLLCAIEEEEESMRKSGYKKSSAMDIVKKRILFAVNVMRMDFYLPLVEPHFKRTIVLDPDNVEAHLYLGEAYYNAMRYGESVEEFERAITLDPYNAYAYKMAGDASVAIGDFDTAKRFYADLININSISPVKYEPSEIEKVKSLMKGFPRTYVDIEKLISSGKTSEAEKELRRRIGLNSSDYVAMTMLGTIYEERGERLAALRLYRAVITIAPDYPIGHLLLAKLSFLMRDYDTAISEFKLFKNSMQYILAQDREYNKMYIDNLYYFSNIYFTLKRYPEGACELDEIVKLDPKEQDAYYNLGVYHYMYAHNPEKAYKLFAAAAAIDPNSGIAASSKSAIEAMRNNPDTRIDPNLSFIDRDYRR